MSYLYWPSGIPGTGIEDGSYAYDQNIHITDGTTSVDAESIRDGLGREISILKNYLSTYRFMSGIPIGTGYFYSIGSSGQPLDSVYIVNAHAYQTTVSTTTDVTYTSDMTTTNLTVDKAVLGDDMNVCKTYFSGWIKGLAFELLSGKLYVSGYLNTTNNNIFDMIGISGNAAVISDTPIDYLDSYSLTSDLYARRLYISNISSGYIKEIYINDGIFGIENYADLVYSSPTKIKLVHTFSSGWIPFQYGTPYHSEHQIIFDDSAGHSSGEGDFSLIDGKTLIFSGATFNDLIYSGILGTTIDWIQITDAGTNKKYLIGQEYKDALYIAQEDWNANEINVIKYHYESGLIGTVETLDNTLNEFSGIITYRNNLYILTNSLQHKFDDTNWTSGSLINSGLFIPFFSGLQASGTETIFNSNLYTPDYSTLYNYTIKYQNGELKSGKITNNYIESFFTYKNLLIAAISGKLYKTNSDYSNLLERNCYGI